VVTEPIGGQLVLRHASKRSSGAWGPDDYDVIDAHGRDIGRIFKAGRRRARRSALALDHHRRGGRAASAVARLLRHSGRGQDEVRGDVARVVGAHSTIRCVSV
jgi:hypothetical protein